MLAQGRGSIISIGSIAGVSSLGRAQSVYGMAMAAVIQMTRELSTEWAGRGVRVNCILPAQVLGAFLGAAAVWLHYRPHWEATEDSDLKFACFATAPAIYSPVWNFFSEVLGTFVLVLVAAALFSKRVSPAGVASGMGPTLVGALVWGIGLSLGGTTGYAINPARDLGPRLAHSLLPIAGKGDSGWKYAWIPVLGPLTGAALAAALIRGLAVV